MKNLIFKENSDLIVAYKPQNVSTQEFLERLRVYLNEDQNLKPIYELDSVCGGTFVCARNQEKYEKLKEDYEKGKFEFTFYAVTVGTPKIESGSYSAHVIFDKKQNKYIHIPQLNAGAETISLNYSVLEKVQQISLVTVKVNNFIPETIRFALADLGMPIFGDATYGGDTLAKDTNTALILGRLRYSENDEGGETFVATPPESKPWTFFDLNKISKL